MKRFVHIFIVFSFVLFFPVSHAFASNYQVTPMALQLDVVSRDILNEHVTLTNKDNHVVRLYASVNEVATDGNGVVNSFKPPSEVNRTDTPTSWVQITRQRIELKPGETRDIPFTIKMNPKTKPGKYNVFIGFAEASNHPEAANIVMSGKAPGMLLGLSVNAPQDQFLHLEQFSVTRFITPEKGGTITYRINNPSRVDVVPSGDIIFYNNRGQEIGSTTINADQKTVPSGKTVTFTQSAPDSYGLGKYKALLTVTYGDHQTSSLNDTAFFYVLPLKELAAIFAAILFLAILLALYFHRRYDLSAEDEGAERISMYIREGHSAEMHHDIDLKASKEDKADST